jgi:hypothetical protein
MDQFAVSILLTCLGYASAAEKSKRIAHVSIEEWQRVVELARR